MLNGQRAQRARVSGGCTTLPSGAFMRVAQARTPLPRGQPPVHVKATAPRAGAHFELSGKRASSDTLPGALGPRRASGGHQQQQQQQQPPLQLPPQQPQQQQPYQPLSFPRPPVLPKTYWRKQDVRKWDAVWNPTDDPAFRSMPVQPNCSQVLDHVLLGNMLFLSDAERLKAEGVTHVLTLTKRTPSDEVRQKFKCMQVVVNDTPQTPVSHHFEEASAQIASAEKEGGRIFVHCRAGVSRGSCFVIAYLMRHRGMTLREAYELVKSRRPIAHPNKGFLQQLKAYEQAVFGKQLSDIPFDVLPYTLWERAEHIGLNDPIPSLALCHEAESKAKEEYKRRYGHPNANVTMDAGLGGKMDLHVVELYSVVDFEWLDKVLIQVLYTDRPADGNYVPRKRPTA
eukprot:TRINITY_DN675_c0_g3_i1.p1 TRINITY_DN675_c0_g3~~TRINITY_DN675_c0_g3_i1.p1  ORF type:complete len:440 (+),score=139.08 TRINITY_DN675_c0_g3_i1:128-1321(+)